MLPFDIDGVHIEVSKHFRNTWMRKRGWDQGDLREAIREAYRSKKSGRDKGDIYVRKKGDKKLVVFHEIKSEEVFVIIGAEG